jgi:CRISPR/Cas system-associated exonuclease Cas4 (RecB family)
MNLPDGFQFSQGSLQDFVDCRRRFLLRYVWGLAWPAVQSEPVVENERTMQQGVSFHRLAHQQLLGVTIESLADQIHDEELERWWVNFLRYVPTLTQAGDGARLYPEITLTAPLGVYRLAAKYDLVKIASGGKATIIDWKTARKRPKRQHLAERLQTRVYPYLLGSAGAQLNLGEPFQPEQVEMVYWFAGFPDQPERFAYDQQQFQADQAYLIELVAEIDRLEEEHFVMTVRQERCAYCVYRSLCDRGVEAGPQVDLAGDLEGDDGLGFSLDFEQIAEIEF